MPQRSGRLRSSGACDSAIALRCIHTSTRLEDPSMHPVRPSSVPLRASALSAALLLALAAPASAELVSESSEFGEDTITHDTETGLRWLDLTESIIHSYAAILTGFDAGGEFEGYRFATDEEVATLWVNAGIDTTVRSFVPQNYDPVVALAELVGQTGDGGNCGTGCTFFFSQAWYDSGSPAPESPGIATLS
ncbi:MAG TPA: hypothetical protein VLC53_05865, partial [Myxococcota bacterium]|nr:hypothetical protein [Myxococcota bacterium]